LVLSASRKNRAAILLFTSAAIGVFIGFAAGKPNLPGLGLPSEKIAAIYGTLRDDPRSFLTEHGEQARGTLALKRVKGFGKVEVSAKGDVLVFFPEGAIPRLKEFGRGCEVYIEGTFLEGRRGELLFSAKSTHITRAAPRIEQFRTGLRANLVERFSRFTWSGLGLALLLGIKDNLDSTLSKRYQEAGCSHVLALSGMHLAIVSAALAFFLKKPLGLRAAAIIGAVFIMAYIYLVGSLPSLNRAALMYLLGTFVILFNLPKNTLSILSMTFVLQIVFQRHEGMSISFVLSYLALFGILVLSKPIYGFFRGWMPDPLGQSLAASMAAFLWTAAASAAFFSVLRPIGIIAGLIITPLTSLFMIGTMLAMAVSFSSLPLLSLLSKPLSLVYAVISRCVTWASFSPPLPASNTTLVLLITLALTGLVLSADKLKFRRRWRSE
jgi:competence protein ComEC